MWHRQPGLSVAWHRVCFHCCHGPHGTSYQPTHRGAQGNDSGQLFLRKSIINRFPVVLNALTSRLSRWQVVYLASLIHIVPGVVLFTSFLIGSGAAVLWTSQVRFGLAVVFALCACLAVVLTIRWVCRGRCSPYALQRVREEDMLVG